MGITSFVGRDAAVAALTRLADEARIVTVLGPGGAGKTRLAQEALGDATFVELGDDTTRDGVRARVAKILDVPEEQVATALAGVVVLDDAERGAASVAAVVGEWLQKTDARFVVTSRVKLGVPGEQLLDIGPLAVSDAVTLFFDRAAAVRPQFQADASEIENIVQALDCLPLAVELAAARMRVLSPRQLAERLEQKLDLLASGETSLRGALDTSWELLDPWLQSALAQCSVFRGGFWLEAAENIVEVADGHTALDAVQALCEQSLVQAYSPGPSRPQSPDRLRYRLYESVRDYAAERLSDDGARDRHVAFYAERSIEEVEDDVDNAVAAHRRAVDSDPQRSLALAVAVDGILKRSGPIRQRVAALDEALAAVQGSVGDAATHAEALLARAQVLPEVGRRDEARTDLEATLEIARGAGDASREGRAIAALGRLAWHAGDNDEAIAHYERALPLLEQAGDRERVALTRSTIANVHQVRGDMEAARAEYEHALRILRDSGKRPDLLGLALGNLATLEHNLDELEAAARHLDESIGILRSCSERFFEGAFLLTRAQVALARGRVAEAQAMGEQALDLQRTVGNRRWEGASHTLLGDIAVAAGDTATARDSFERAADMLREYGHPMLEGTALCKLARCEAIAGRMTVAEQRLAAARDRLSDEGPLTALADICAGELALARGDAQGAAALAERATDAAARSSEVRAALLQLRTALGSAAGGAPLAIGPEGRWFEPPGEARVDLSRRHSLRLIMLALANADQPLTLDQLIAAGWPGETVVPEAGQSRVYTAVATLRRMGLRDILLRRDDGYLLDPSTPINRG